MQDEIKAAYQAGHDLVKTMRTVSHLRFQRHSIPHAIGNDAADSGEQWQLIQEWLKDAQQKNRIEIDRMERTISVLDEQLRGLRGRFEPISDALHLSYASLGNFELGGIPGRDIRVPLYEAGHCLSHWAKQFVLAFLHERSHVIGSRERQELDVLRDECPVTDGMLGAITDRLYLESSQLKRDQLLHDQMTILRVEQEEKPKKTPKETLDAARAQTLQKFLDAEEIWQEWKRSKLPLDQFETRVAAKIHEGSRHDLKLTMAQAQTTYHTYTAKGWTATKVRTELNRRIEEAERVRKLTDSA